MIITLTRKSLFIIMVALTLILGIWLGNFFKEDLKIAFGASSSDYDVKAYGAAGDGAADDTAEIQNAINAAQSAGGGVVFFPKGSYKVSSTLTVTGHNVQLEGTGKGSSVFLNTSTGAVIKIGHATDMTQTTHNKVKNLTVDRSVAPSSDSYGIFVERARFTVLDGVTVYNAGYGIAVGPSGVSGIPNQFTNIINSWIMRSGSMQAASVFPDSGIMFFSGADHKVSNVFIEPSNRGIVMAGNSNGILMDQVSIINGGAYNYGLVSDGTGFARYFNNGIIENALHQQVFVGGASERFTISNSWIGAGDTNGTTRVGIQIQPGAKKVTIANNRIGDQRNQGIISKGDQVIIIGNILEGNVNSGCACDSLQVEGGKRVTITGNRIDSAADRYGVGLYNSGSYTLDNYIYTDNDTSLSGSGYNNAATGATKVIADNLY